MVEALCHMVNYLCFTAPQSRSIVADMILSERLQVTALVQDGVDLETLDKVIR